MLGRRALGRLERIVHIACRKRPRYAEDVDRAQAYDERLPLPALAARVRTVWIQRTGKRPVLQRNLPTGGAGSVPDRRHATLVGRPPAPRSRSASGLTIVAHGSGRAASPLRAATSWSTVRRSMTWNEASDLSAS
jgi:hypothetical protein